MGFFKSKESAAEVNSKQIDNLLLDNEIVEFISPGLKDNLFITNMRVVAVTQDIKYSNTNVKSIPRKYISSIDLVQSHGKLTSAGDTLIINTNGNSVSLNLKNPTVAYKELFKRIC